MEPKKYKVTAVTDFRYLKDENLTKNSLELKAICEKWMDKEITLAEMEENIEELNCVIFDGVTIQIYNDYVS